MRIRSHRTLLVLGVVALATSGSACIYTIFTGTTLASATTPIKVRGLAPEGLITPGQTVCPMVKDPAFPPILGNAPFRMLASTRVAMEGVHVGPDHNPDFFGYLFDPVVIPPSAFVDGKATLYVSTGCTPTIFPFSLIGRVFENQAQLDCFVGRIEDGHTYFDTTCAPFNFLLEVRRP